MPGPQHTGTFGYRDRKIILKQSFFKHESRDIEEKSPKEPPPAAWHGFFPIARRHILTTN
jgi:hypothetical protein